ncbi:MAG: hypothetical protein ACOYH0_07040 [Saccharofermentanales bacterium]|jgi:hypothetical protein
MEKANITSILASFATMKNLFDARSYQNPYQLLSEFISYIISSNNLHSFTAVEMKNRLQDSFGFEIPEAVVKTSIKSLDFIKSENKQFVVESSVLNADPLFEEKKQAAENISTNIIDLLETFVMKKEPYNTIWSDALTQEFVGFLIDDEPKPDSRYTELISQFVLENENDATIQDALTSIREGSILYIGLNHNINETGSIKTPLTLYLGTEVLFSLYGLNGEIHKRLAHDLYEQIKLANSSDKKIFLRYFAKTKKEINDFFASAESIVAGKRFFNDTVAMKAIINGCDTVGDVKVKESDFYYVLQYSYGIMEDDKKDYYSEENDKYNLESLITDEELIDSVQFISHINKLRKGRIYNSNIDAQYFIITNSRNTLEVSKNQSERDKEENSTEFVSDYAVSVNKMTNLLWYKLGNSFGRKNYPCNVDAVLKARVVLAAHISQSVSKLYFETKSKYKAGEITEEQLAARIIALRGKTTIPEDLDTDTIEDSLDFSPEFLSRFEEEVLSNKTALEEKEKLIQTLESQNQQIITEKDNVIAEKDQILHEKDQMLHEKEKHRKSLEKELEKYRLKKEQRKKILLFIWGIIWKLLIVVFVTVIAINICKKMDSGMTTITIVCAVIDVLGILAIVWTTVKNEKGKYFPKDK